MQISDLPCDNKQADKQVSHIMNGNDMCQCGKVGGAAVEHESPEGFAQLHNVHSYFLTCAPQLSLLQGLPSADSQRYPSGYW
jgi:hypothetical protein